MFGGKTRKIHHVSNALCDKCYAIADETSTFSDDVRRKIKTDINKNGEILIVYELFGSYTAGFIKGNIDEQGPVYNIKPLKDLKTAQIEWLFVREDFKRQGVGASLVKAFHDYVQKKNVQATYAAIINEPAVRAFYRKQGFAKIKNDTLFYKKLEKVK